MVCCIAALAYKKLLALALPSKAETIHASYAIWASPACLSKSEIKLMKSLGLQEATLLMENFITTTASKVIDTLRLIVA